MVLDQDKGDLTTSPENKGSTKSLWIDFPSAAPELFGRLSNEAKKSGNTVDPRMLMYIGPEAKLAANVHGALLNGLLTLNGEDNYGGFSTKDLSPADKPESASGVIFYSKKAEALVSLPAAIEVANRMITAIQQLEGDAIIPSL